MKQNPSSMSLPNGRTDRPVQTGLIFGPKVSGIQDNNLVYNPDEKVLKKPRSGMLRSFLELVDAEPDDVYRYAKRWVGLGTENQQTGRRSLEPVAIWKKAAGRLCAIRNIGADLNNGGRGQ